MISFIKKTYDKFFNNKSTRIGPHCAYPWQQFIIDLTGEVVPCCYWSGYGNSGKPLGNTNANTLEEIWNGEEYVELRRLLSSGEVPADHPCAKCAAYIWANNNYPPFEWPMAFKKEEGHCFTAQIPERVLDEAEASGAPIILHENGLELPGQNAQHATIRNKGGGTYSTWGRVLYFSASDNTDPGTNKKSYQLTCGKVSYDFPQLIEESTSGQNILKAYEEYLGKAIELESRPTMLTYISTSDCNIDCPSCSQNQVRILGLRQKASTENDVLELVPYLYQLVWHGGEPFIIKNFQMFVKNFQQKDNPNLTFGFTTNGTLLNKDVLKKLKTFPRLNASISIDSFYKSTFDMIRTGADYRQTMANLKHAMKVYSAPATVFNVGMIILKDNFLELAENIEYAMEHDIGMNLSPVVVYPIHQRLDIFQNFEEQTKGWELALHKAKTIVEKGKAEKRRAFERIDPMGMLLELENIYNASAKRYMDTFDITVEIHDPHQSLAKMKRPAIVFSIQNRWTTPLSYALLEKGAGEYQLSLPRKELTGNNFLEWYLFHDMCEDVQYIASDWVCDSHYRPLHKTGWKKAPKRYKIIVPPFNAVERKSNLRASHGNIKANNELMITDKNQITQAVIDLMEKEREQGFGLQGEGTRSEVIQGTNSRETLSRYHEFTKI